MHRAFCMDTNVIGHHMIYHEEIMSTQDTLMAAATSVPDGTVLVSGRQVAGRGRMGRMWVSPAGTLTFSVLLRPNIPPDRSGMVMLAAAISLYDTICRYVPHVRLEWPNDMAADGKLAGIVLDSSITKSLQWVVVGVGININTDPREVAQLLRHDAGFGGADSISRYVPNISAVDIMANFLLHLDSYHTDMAGKMDHIVSEYQKKCFDVGRWVCRGDIQGTALGVGQDGALLVETDVGVHHVLF